MLMRWVVFVVVPLVVVAGCTPTSSPAPSTPPVTSAPSTTVTSPAPVAPGTKYGLPPDRDTAQWGEPVASKVGKKLSNPTLNLSREGWRVDLMGVYRLAEDRVLAEFRLNADNALRSDMHVWVDPDYDAWFHQNDRRNGGYQGSFWEFSDVRLSVPGDDASYRPVRTRTNFCLCSMTNQYIKGYGDFPAYVVLSTPKGATSVDLSLRDVGTFSGVVVSPSMPTRSVVPLGFGYQLRLQGVSRPAPGTLRARYSLELPAGGVPGTMFRVRYLYQIDGGAPWKILLDLADSYQGVLAVDPGGVDGGWPKTGTEGACDSCTKVDGQLTKPGTAVDLEIDLPDPGTQDVMVAATGAWPFSGIAVAGSPSAAQGLVQYRWQQVSTGATIGKDDISLDAAVLFTVDKATLTPRANAVLDRAAKALQAQDGRAVQIVGHTDSTGSTAHNQDLSERRAAAVKNGLAQRLGAGWTFTVKGVGETDPQVKETGLGGAKLARARELNRRVEVSVK